MSSIHNYIKVPDGLNNSATGGDVDSRLYQNNETVLAVLKGYYDVRIVKGSDSFIYDSVDCTGNTCTLDKSTLTVKFPGIASVHTYVYASNNVPGTVSGSPVGSQTYKTDQAVFANLVNGVYDVKVVKGAEVKIIDNVTVLGNWATVDNIVATLTVNFPGIVSVHTSVKVNNGAVGTATGGDVDNRTYKTDQATLVVLRDVYDLKVVKGAEVKFIDAMNCNAAACTVDNIVATLTINFPGIASVHSYVKVNDGVGGTASGGDVDNRSYKTDQAQLVVLRSTYEPQCPTDGRIAGLETRRPATRSSHVRDHLKGLPARRPRVYSSRVSERRRRTGFTHRSAPSCANRVRCERAPRRYAGHARHPWPRERR